MRNLVPAKILGTLLVWLVAVPAMAAESDVATAVRNYFEKGEFANPATAGDVTIIDEVPPFVWKGSNAVTTWLEDLKRYDLAEGNSEGALTIKKVTREEVVGDRAYVVAQARYAFKRQGKSMRADSQAIVGLERLNNAWRVIAWTYAGPRASAVK